MPQAAISIFSPESTLPSSLLCNDLVRFLGDDGALHQPLLGLREHGRGSRQQSGIRDESRRVCTRRATHEQGGLSDAGALTPDKFSPALGYSSASTTAMRTLSQLFWSSQLVSPPYLSVSI